MTPVVELVELVLAVALLDAVDTVVVGVVVAVDEPPVPSGRPSKLLRPHAIAPRPSSNGAYEAFSPRITPEPTTSRRRSPVIFGLTGRAARP